MRRNTMLGRFAIPFSISVLAIPSVAHAGTLPPSQGGATIMTSTVTTTPAPSTQAPVIGTAATAVQQAGDVSIRPFQYHASDAELAELKRRILATR
jgi:hypothetical protein